MTIPTPAFFSSPFFVSNFGNWRLKKGAPKKTIAEFEKFMQDYKMPFEKEGVNQ